MRKRQTGSPHPARNASLTGSRASAPAYRSAPGIVRLSCRLGALMAAMLTGLVFGAESEAQSRNQMRITGSSSVFPFSTLVAEEFGRSTRFRAPIVESIGSGGGLQQFCQGLGANTPDIANASRRIKQSEVDLCASNGVRDIVEIRFGYDGIVLANTKAGDAFRLSLREIYLALAKSVPARLAGTKSTPTGDAAFMENPFDNWTDINPDLPDQEIIILGPPPTSGTRDAFNERAMEAGCNMIPEIRALEHDQPGRHKQLCRAYREDGRYVESGENDNLIVQKIQADPDAIGIFAFSFLDQNSDILQPIGVRNKAGEPIYPTFANIGEGRYPIFRSLFFYVKAAHAQVIPGVKPFLLEFTRERTWGPFGYLVDRGLIPLSEKDRKLYRLTARELIPLDLSVNGPAPEARRLLEQRRKSDMAQDEEPTG
ncbi:substrate-binding domain-containing protein [Yunchengibacter salinarum]|uniref:substrate-binding domain-containing protein n=1 Tax=Yunchengibacter salinarum TaxID=3133399 RepID=UPI0035B5F64F